MSLEMSEGSGESEDGSIDLNKEPPVERKRKRAEMEKNGNSIDRGNQGSDGLPKSGRVLRSRTVAMSDGEKKAIEMGAVNFEDENESKGLAVRKMEKKGKRGRPRNTEIKCKVPSLGPQKKRKRGRPPKNGVKSEVICLSGREDDGKTVELEKADESSSGAGRGRGRPKGTGKRGRPRKMEKGDIVLAIKKKIVKKSGGSDRKNIGKVEFDEGSETGLKEQRQLKKDKIVSKVGTNDSGAIIMKQKKVTGAHADSKGMSIREQKQLVRDQIVDMITKAGWTVEYRQRQSRDYQDAVYVDRERRAYWSVTLAYKKLKERVDHGKADERDTSAFSPLPEETLGLLFRITDKDKKSGNKKNIDGRTIKTKTKNESYKSKSSDGRVKLRDSRWTLLARKRRDGLGSGDSEVYEGNRNLLAWMINLGTVPLGGKVKYKRARRILLEGKLTKEGICCDCCNINRGLLEFESHAGGTPGNPYEDIYLDSGISLSQCLVDSWKKHVKNANIRSIHVDVEGDDPNDDTCNICGDGGDLICCDSCPSTFHNGCLCIEVPSGDWHCVYCSCKFCGTTCGSTSTSEDDDSDLLICRLCEQIFHSHCVEGTIAKDPDYGNRPFCGKECFEIFEQLQVLIGVGQKIEEGFSYTILRHVANGGASLNDASKVETNAKLAVTYSVMDESFEPIIDERSGANMIHNVVYSCGSNIIRLNYEGFYTFILEKGEEAVAAASIRIHGSQLAEMPFIGTRFMYRRQGICGRLLTSIENVLYSLGVEKLVIPAISELNETWTKVFGFGPLEKSTRHEMRNMSMIVFPGVNMLQKPVVGHQSIKGQMDSAECTEVRPEHQNTQENVKSTTQSTGAETRPEVTREEQSEENEGLDKKEVVESGETMPSLNKPDTKFEPGNNDGESSENGDDCLDATKETM